MGKDFTPTAPVSQAQFRTWRRWAGVGFLGLALAFGFVWRDSTSASEEGRDAIVTSGKVVSVEGCNRDFKTISGARDSVAIRLDLLKSYRKDPSKTQLSPQEVEVQIAASEQTLELLPLPDCRSTENLITDDPRDTEFPPPNPLYPGSPDALDTKSTGQSSAP